MDIQSLFNLNGRVAVVTGGSRGIGKMIVEGYLKAGAARVYISARKVDQIEETVAEFGNQVIGLPCDLSTVDGCLSLAAQIAEREEKVDILVNNAGAGGKIVPVGEQTDASIVDTIFTNLIGPMLGSRRIIPGMISRGDGVIVNISSACSFKSWPGWSIYSAAKAGLEQFARGLYVELRPHGIRVSTIIPAWGATEFTKAADLPGHPAGDPEIAKQCIQPSEMGQTVLNICTQPKHLAVLELTLLPLVQEICPL
jgi:NAD(P)-dependent dehydrogenase (short-subunit alcohol dehydrogenase family)